MKDNKTPRTGIIDIKKALSFVTMLLFMILTYCVILKIYGVKPLYENIDDYFLKMISSGEISTVPEAHLRYISIVSGVLLKLLYTIFPGASWYGIWLLSLYMAAFSSILYALADLFESFWKKAAIIALFIAILAGMFWVPLIFVQYTTVTIVLAGAAGALLYTKHYILGTILFWLSMSVRIKGALLVLPLIVIVFTVDLFREEKKRDVIRHAAVLFAGCFVVFSLEMIFNSSYTWRTYNSYDTHRQNMTDYNGYPDYEEYADIYEKYNVSQNSYNALTQRYLLLLDDNLTKDFMEELDSINPKHDKSRGFKRIIGDFYERSVTSYIDRPLHLLVYTLYFLTFLSALFLKRKDIITDIIALFAARMIMWSYLLYIDRCPTRISQGLYIMEAFMLIAALLKIISCVKGKKTIPLVLLSVILTLAVTVKWGYPYSKSYSDYSKERQTFITAYEDVRLYINDHPDSFFFLDTNSFLYFSENLVTKNLDSKGNWTYLGCWIANTPWTDRLLKYNGFSSWETVPFEKDDTYYIFLNSDSTGYDYLDQYYSDKYPNAHMIAKDTITTENGLEYLITKLEIQ